MSQYFTAPMMFLPYIVCFLFHVANWFSWLLPSSSLRRLIILTHRHSPRWLRNALAWCWPNIGLLLHVHRLLMLYMVALGYMPQNAATMSVSNNAHRAKFFGIIYRLSVANLLPYLMYKLLIMTCESYDLRAVVLVAFLLDGPVWYAFCQSRGITNALESVILFETITIITQALLASLRGHYGHFLLPQNIINTVGVGKLTSSISHLKKKGS